MRSLGLALATQALCRFFKIQMFILIHCTNLAAQNAAKQRITKYQPQKPHSNNTRSVVKGLPPKGRCLLLLLHMRSAHLRIFGFLEEFAH